MQYEKKTSALFRAGGNKTLSFHALTFSFSANSMLGKYLVISYCWGKARLSKADSQVAEERSMLSILSFDLLSNYVWFVVIVLNAVSLSSIM